MAEITIHENNPIFTEKIADVMIKKGNAQPKKDDLEIKELHLKHLDDLVNVNCLLTIGVFIGLSMATPGIRSLDNRDECNAGPSIAKRLIVYEVVAFSCFLLSSIVAKVIKLHLHLDGIRYDFVTKGIDLKDILLTLAACGSVAGIILLILSIVDIIQIRIGLLSCSAIESKLAVIFLVLIAGIAVVIYVVSMCIAIFASIKSDVVAKGDRENVTYKATRIYGDLRNGSSSSKLSYRIGTDGNLIKV